MKALLIKIESIFIGKKRFQPFFEMLHRISLRGMNYNQAMSTSKSGEINALKYASKKSHSNARIFDVGANVGDWTKTALEIFEGPEMYLFEPSTHLIEDLTKRYQDRNDIKCFPVGLSDKEGVLELYNTGDSTATSFPLEENLHHETITVTTLKQFCEAEGIHDIFYLKIDVEGNEYNILKGCEDMLRSNKIRFIQFEFGANTIVSRVFLKDFYDMLVNYNIYKIVKDGLIKWDYSIEKEIHLPSNFLAELK